MHRREGTAEVGEPLDLVPLLCVRRQNTFHADSADAVLTQPGSAASVSSRHQTLYAPVFARADNFSSVRAKTLQSPGSSHGFLHLRCQCDVQIIHVLSQGFTRS